MLNTVVSYTDYFGIQDRDVPFENLAALQDTPLFVDPHAIRFTGGPQPYQQNAVQELDTFLNELSLRVIQSPADGGGLLDHIGEPKETRLGVTRNGYYGHAASTKLAGKIWCTLITDLQALFRLGIIKHLEELTIFVEGIDRDITSDITTRIIFNTLAKFTQDCAAQFPELLSRGTSKLAKFAWIPEQTSWQEKEYEVPAIEGAPLILIPQGWSRKQLMGNADKYYRMGPIGYLQRKQSRYDGRGKLLQPTKTELMQQLSGKIRDINIGMTMTAINDQSNLVDAFWAYVDDYYDTHPIIKS